MVVGPADLSRFGLRARRRRGQARPVSLAAASVSPGGRGRGSRGSPRGPARGNRLPSRAAVRVSGRVRRCSSSRARSSVCSLPATGRLSALWIGLCRADAAKRCGRGACTRRGWRCSSPDGGAVRFVGGGGGSARARRRPVVGGTGVSLRQPAAGESRPARVHAAKRRAGFILRRPATARPRRPPVPGTPSQTSSCPRCTQISGATGTAPSRDFWASPSRTDRVTRVYTIGARASPPTCSSRVASSCSACPRSFRGPPSEARRPAACDAWRTPAVAWVAFVATLVHYPQAGGDPIKASYLLFLAPAAAISAVGAGERLSARSRVETRTHRLVGALRGQLRGRARDHLLRSPRRLADGGDGDAPQRNCRHQGRARPGRARRQHGHDLVVRRMPPGRRRRARS